MSSEKGAEESTPEGNHNRVQSNLSLVHGEKAEGKASPVSCDCSNDGRDRCTNSVAENNGSYLPQPQTETPNQSAWPATASTATGDSLENDGVKTEAALTDLQDSNTEKRHGRTCRSISHENCDTKAGAVSGTEGITPATTYQSLEERLRSERMSPSSGQSAKSGPDTEAGEDEGASQSAVVPILSDGPPRIITTKPDSNSGKKSGQMRRRGKWTAEEEAYVARVIQDFNSGFLDAPAGTTLRTFLSDKLNCDPMRITKKFTGEACIGKRVFHPAIRSPSNAAAIDKAQVS